MSAAADWAPTGVPGEAASTEAIYATVLYVAGAVPAATAICDRLDTQFARPAGTTLGIIAGLLSAPTGIPGGATCAA